MEQRIKSMEELKEWVEYEIAIAKDQLKNASSNEEYDRVEAKKFTLERVLDRINFYISEENSDYGY